MSISCLFKSTKIATSESYPSGIAWHVRALACVYFSHLLLFAFLIFSSIVRKNGFIHSFGNNLVPIPSHSSPNPPLQSLQSNPQIPQMASQTVKRDNFATHVSH